MTHIKIHISMPQEQYLEAIRFCKRRRRKLMFSKLVQESIEKFMEDSKDV
jgi:hypothetical protein